MRQIRTWFKKYTLILVWLPFQMWIYADYLRDPGSFAYGHNHEGDLLSTIVLSLGELAVLYTILRPWSIRIRSLRRILATLCLSVPWLFFSVFLCMHAGGILAIHALWVLAVNAGLAMAAVLSILVLAWDFNQRLQNDGKNASK